MAIVAKREHGPIDRPGPRPSDGGRAESARGRRTDRPDDSILPGGLSVGPPMDSTSLAIEARMPADPGPGLRLIPGPGGAAPARPASDAARSQSRPPGRSQSPCGTKPPRERDGASPEAGRSRFGGASFRKTKPFLCRMYFIFNDLRKVVRCAIARSGPAARSPAAPGARIVGHPGGRITILSGPGRPGLSARRAGRARGHLTQLEGDGPR